MSRKQIMRAVIATVVTAAALFALARASATPIGMKRAESARLRLSWSARPERIEVCRTLSEKELEKLEEHMRQRVQCDGRFATYALQVDSDGRVLHQSIVRGAGLRHDRPLYLLREIDLPAGAHRVRITFARREMASVDSVGRTNIEVVRADTGLFAGRAQREVAERVRRAAAAIPARLELDTTMTFAANRVILVSLDPERRALRVLSAWQ